MLFPPNEVSEQLQCGRYVVVFVVVIVVPTILLLILVLLIIASHDCTVLGLMLAANIGPLLMGLDDTPIRVAATFQALGQLSDFLHGHVDPPAGLVHTVDNARYTDPGLP
jgi:hypothetical protein